MVKDLPTIIPSDIQCQEPYTVPEIATGLFTKPRDGETLHEYLEDPFPPGEFTVKVNCAVRVNPPPVPVTVTVYDPVGVQIEDAMVR
jgi:hypothetical protein